MPKASGKMAISVEVKYCFFSWGKNLGSWVSKHEMCLVDGGTYSLLPAVRNCLQQQPQPVHAFAKCGGFACRYLALRKKGV